MIYFIFSLSLTNRLSASSEMTRRAPIFREGKSPFATRRRKVLSDRSVRRAACLNPTERGSEAGVRRSRKLPTWFAVLIIYPFSQCRRGSRKSLGANGGRE